MQKKGRYQTGFSLIELVVVIVVLTIITGVVSQLLKRQFEAYFESRDLTTNQEESLFSFIYLTEGLQEIRSPTDIIVAANNQISFVNAMGETVTYLLNANQLVRKEGASSQVVADHIQNFGLSYYDVTGAVISTLTNIRYININVTIQNGNEKNIFNTQVYPRF